MVPPATPYQDLKVEWDDGSIVQIKIWRLPEASAERPHRLKYSLFYGRPGERIIGYDNEAGKGDHRHYREVEEAYKFVTVERLLLDFWTDVAKEYERE
jgi:hypothetical protein